MLDFFWDGLKVLRPLELPPVRVGLLFLLTLCITKLGPEPLRRLLRWIDHIARKRSLVLLVAFVTSLGMSCSLAYLSRIPYPSSHDEFSYLLAGDTFANGRITSPTHPMREHFETFHVLQRPSYMSKYPPGQGLFLALGQKISGFPITGVWLSTALACAAVCWMLYGWVPSRWAFIGGLLSTGYAPVVGWSQEYWGGSVAVFGGAVVLGAVGRLIRRGAGWPNAALLGLGLAILANSRPFEGLAYSLPLMSALLAWALGRSAPPVRQVIRQIAIPFVAILLPTAVAMCYYNWRITGNAFRMPHVAYEEQYSIVPVLLWRPVRPDLRYPNKEFEAWVMDWALPMYRRQQTLSGWIKELKVKLPKLLPYLQPWVLAIPLICVPWLGKRDRLSRILLLTTAVFLAALLSETWMMLYFSAPIAGLIVLFMVMGMRRLYAFGADRQQYGMRLLAIGVAVFLATQLSDELMDSRFAALMAGLAALMIVGMWGALVQLKGARLGRSIVAAICLLYALYCSLAVADRVQNSPAGWGLQRNAVVSELRARGGRHLILVRYEKNHSFHEEWVYNNADIDSADLVWAREVDDPAKNRALLEYFGGRQVWLLVDDGLRARFGPFPNGPVRFIDQPAR